MNTEYSPSFYSTVQLTEQLNDKSPDQLPRELRRRYLDRRIRDIEECERRLLLGDFAFFERLAHQLKGNAPSYGFNHLRKIALKIESHAREKSAHGLATCISEFKTWLQEVNSCL